MTQPYGQPQGQFPQAFAPPQQQGYAPQPQQGYAPPAPQYAPPQQYGPPQPQQGYAPQQPYGQPQQQYAPPVEPPPNSTLDDFWSQPSTGGGQALSFKQQGTAYMCEVTRDVADSDIQIQTEVNNPQKLATYRDGRYKKVMKVPVRILQSNVDTSGYAEGVAQWFCAGAARDELARAMTAIGLQAQHDPPKAGDQFQITYTGDRSAGPGMNPAKQYQLVYYRSPEVAARVASGVAASEPAQPEQASAFPQAPAPQAPAPQGQSVAPASMAGPGQMQAPAQPQQSAPMSGFAQQAPQQMQAPAPAQQEQAPAPLGGFAQQQAQPQAPAPMQQGQVAAPAQGQPLDADQQALFERLLRQQQGQG